MATFWNWHNACKFLNRKIERLKPLPGNNVVLEKTASGCRINVLNTPGGDGGYQGFFKVFDASTPDTENGGIAPAVAVADGRLSSGERMFYTAGLAVINDTHLECPPNEITLTAGVSYITANFYLSGDIPVFGGYSARQGGIASGFESLSIILAVAEADENSVRIYQQQHGMIYNYLFRSC